MFQTHKNFIEIENMLYQIVRVIKESENPIVDALKEYLVADRVFRKEGNYYFVREVPEAEIVID